jgi:hypothetical protein
MKMSCWPSTSTRITSLSTSGGSMRGVVSPDAVRTSAVQVKVEPAASAEPRRNVRRLNDDVMLHLCFRADFHSAAA